jgi:hypothetical protein
MKNEERMRMRHVFELSAIGYRDPVIEYIPQLEFIHHFRSLPAETSKGRVYGVFSEHTRDATQVHITRIAS